MSDNEKSREIYKAIYEERARDFAQGLKKLTIGEIDQRIAAIITEMEFEYQRKTVSDGAVYQIIKNGKRYGTVSVVRSGDSWQLRQVAPPDFGKRPPDLADPVQPSELNARIGQELENMAIQAARRPDTAVSTPNDSVLTAEEREYRSELLKILRRNFGEGDLKMLYFELGWEYGQFESGGKDAQARALVEKCFREARQNELVDLIAQYRPKITLPKSLE